MEKKWILFEKGNLSGTRLFTTEEYSHTFINGDTDSEMMEDVRLILRPNSIVFDVGGFMGASSLVFSSFLGPDGKVITFEPNGYNRKRILQNIEKNEELAKKIKVYPYALSDKNGKMEMVLSKDLDSGFSSTSRLGVAHSKINEKNLPKGFYYEKVDVKSLDSFVGKTGLIPDVVKVDVEGAEHLLLNGSLITLKKYRPVLYIEIHSEFCALKCAQILIDANYDFQVIKEEEDNRVMIKAIPKSRKSIFRKHLKIILNNLVR